MIEAFQKDPALSVATLNHLMETTGFDKKRIQTWFSKQRCKNGIYVAPRLTEHQKVRLETIFADKSELEEDCDELAQLFEKSEIPIG